MSRYEESPGFSRGEEVNELPVDWFDSPEPSDVITNNDLEPTALDPGDYAPFWDTAREWIEPHPDMEGYRCSTGWHHVAYQKSPVPPMLDDDLAQPSDQA